MIGIQWLQPNCVAGWGREGAAQSFPQEVDMKNVSHSSHLLFSLTGIVGVTQPRRVAATSIALKLITIHHFSFTPLSIYFLPTHTGIVGVTQPRRVAATSTAARVAAELGTPLGQLVGYQVCLWSCSERVNVCVWPV